MRFKADISIDAHAPWGMWENFFDFPPVPLNTYRNGLTWAAVMRWLWREAVLVRRLCTVRDSERPLSVAPYIICILAHEILLRLRTLHHHPNNDAN